MNNGEESLHELWDIIIGTNLCIIGIPKGEEREKGTDRLFKEIMAENFPNLGRNSAIQVHEAHRSPNKFNFLVFSKIHYNKSEKLDRILKAAR